MRRIGGALALTMALAACSAGAVDHPQPEQAHSEGATAATTGGSWLTYHHDGRRTGVDTTSPKLGTVTHAWTSPTLDGAIYAEPLIRSGRVYVATEHDSVYALSASTGHVIWRRNVGSAVPGSSLPCGNIDPSGITGTPVIRAKTNTLYAVAFVRPAHHELVAIDTSTGRLKWRRNADPSGVDPKVHQERGASVIANGRVYTPYGGLDGDCGEYHGRVVGRALDGSGPLLHYKVPTQREAGIWATSGVAANSKGQLFVATGNGTSSSTFDYGNAVIRLSANLEKQAFWAPSNWRSLNSGDVDLGSIGPGLLPNDLIFQAGKQGVGYLVRQGHMGGIGGSVFRKQVCDSAWGGTAYAGGRVFVPCADGLTAVRIKSGPSFGVAWQAGGFFAGPPIVAGGAVWTVDIDGNSLMAFDPATGHRLLSRTIPSVEHFTTPASAGGQLYVACGNRVVAFAGI